MVVLEVPVRGDDQVDEHAPPLAVEGAGVLVVALPHGRGCGDRGEFLHCLVPCNHGAFGVDGKSGVGKEVDDVGEPFFRCSKRELGLHPADCLPELVGELGELRAGVAAFLEVKVGAVIDRSDHDFLAALAGEKDVREGAVPGPDLF